MGFHLPAKTLILVEERKPWNQYPFVQVHGSVRFMLFTMFQARFFVGKPSLLHDAVLFPSVLWFTQLVSHGELVSRWRVSVVLYSPSED
jgi:hypothetical protein